jgi:hypothetical protein
LKILGIACHNSLTKPPGAYDNVRIHNVCTPGSRQQKADSSRFASVEGDEIGVSLPRQP